MPAGEGGGDLFAHLLPCWLVEGYVLQLARGLFPTRTVEYKILGSSGKRVGRGDLWLVLNGLKGKQGLSACWSGRTPEASPALPHPTPGYWRAGCCGVFLWAVPPNPLNSLDPVSSGCNGI